MKNGLIAMFLITLIGSVILACDLFSLDSTVISDTPQDQLTDNLRRIPVLTPTFKVIDELAVQLTIKEAGYCRALAPADWSFSSIPPYVGADLFSSDQSSHAAWGITSMYKAFYPTTQSALLYLLNAMGYQGASILNEPVEVGYGFMAVGFTSGMDRQGQIIFKRYDLDESFYVLSVYLGSTNFESWEINGPQALTSAISIRCVPQLGPSIENLEMDLSDALKDEDNPEVELSDKWSEAILGFENVFSPTTGEHYLAPLESYWETGPQGGGYYRELPGGGVEKLMRGFGEY